MSFDRLISLLSIVTFVAGASFYQPIPKLLGTDSFHSSQGTSVALSKAGNLIISGGPTAQNSVGSVWIFNRTTPDSDGFEQVQQLAPFNVSTPTPKFGSAVTISNTENFIVVGGDEGGPAASGAVWVFIQDQNQRNYYLPQSKIIGSDQIGESKQGTSIAISSEGRILAVGGPGDNNNVGAVWVFTWSIDATSWEQMGDKLVGDDIDNVAKFGWSVDLSSDGKILAVGGPLDNGNLGAAWIFTLDQTWSQQGRKLIGNNGGRLHAEQGTSVALSSSGTILAVGGPYDDNFRGGVWIFNRNEDTKVWFQVGTTIRGSDATINSVMMGSSVDLSSTGDILIFGGSNDYPYGALWVFQKDNQTNTYKEVNKLVGQDTQDGDVDINIGYSLSVSDNGLIVITGAPSDDNGTGAVWVFTVSLGDEDEKNPTVIIILVVLVTFIIFVGIYLYITKNTKTRPFTQLKDNQPLNLGPDNSTHPVTDLNNSEHPTRNSTIQ